MRIIGSGSCIPEVTLSNEHFENRRFLNQDGNPLNYSTETIISKFAAITGIEERRHAKPSQVASDLASDASAKALACAGVDPESIDYIIMAHNFGDVRSGSSQSDAVPSLAARIKNRLGIKNPECVAYDLLFGCPGWIEGMIQANAFVSSGIARRCLVVGGETLSRVSDACDRDSMIYADGAGAVVVEAGAGGVLSHISASHTLNEAGFLYLGSSHDPKGDPDQRYIKMQGRKIYEFALSHVPEAMKRCLEKAGIDITEVKKILIHQANEKMDQAIVSRFYGLYNMAPPAGIMPMSIRLLGNSSVATVPTLYDLIRRGEMPGHRFDSGGIILFASVGAGMNINAMAYRI